MLYDTADERPPMSIPQLADDPVARLRDVHLGMLDAVLAGGGIAPVARLAAQALGGAVVVALPALDLTVSAPDAGDRRAAAVARHVEDPHAPTPLELAATARVNDGERPLGAVVQLGPRRLAGPHAEQVLALAALAVRTAVSLEDPGAVHAGAGALFAALRDDPVPDRILARAAVLGADLRFGGVVLVAAPAPGAVQRTVAAVRQEAPHALVHVAGERVEALVPAGSPGDRRPAAAEQAGRAARAADRHGAAGVSAAEADAGALPRALREAEFVLALVERGEAGLEEAQTGAWRLLTRLAVMAPAEVERLAGASVGPLLEPGTRSGAALLVTLATYLKTGASMRATAQAGFAHRHTIAYRLERIAELTGHDPRATTGREQLTLGLKALAVSAALR
jgi:hypothetical protein